MLVRWTILLATLVAIVLPGTAHAEKRVALVIGNSAYSKISPLANPKNDAQLIARTLSEVGFDVVMSTDVDRLSMARAISKFGRRLRRAGKNAVAPAKHVPT